MTATKGSSHGPWQVFQAVSENGQPWGAMRSIRHPRYTCEQLKINGKPARFESAAAVRIAIEKEPQ